LAIAHDLDVAATCQRLLGRRVAAWQRIRGGRNNQVFRIEGDPHTAAVILKHYFTSAGDPRDRLTTEYEAVRLLRGHGITVVPTALAIDRDARCVLYQCMPGVPAASQPATDADVDQAVTFLGDLRSLARQSRADVANAASEAHFSIDAVIDHVAARAERIRALPADTPERARLSAFMTDRFTPAMDALRTWTGAQARRLTLRTDVDLPAAERTLSPSDFGLHNALRDDAGRLAFVDFEYFGWDDPAKTIADFVLHPGMELSTAQRRAFAQRMLELFADTPALAGRATVLYPWFGLKWSLILLNEFLAGDRGRREFAGNADLERRHLLDERLTAAQRMLTRVETEYSRNPYLA
jgi:hypothetical protein